MLPYPVAQSLFNHSQAARCRRLALARLNKPRRLLLEFKRVPAPLPIPHLRYPFALEQLAKGYVLRGQGQHGQGVRSGPRAIVILHGNPILAISRWTLEFPGVQERVELLGLRSTHAGSST